MGAGKMGIRRDRPLEAALRQLVVGCREAVEVAEADVIVGPCVQSGRIAQTRQARLVEWNVDFQRRNQMSHDPRSEVADLVDGATSRSAQMISSALNPSVRGSRQCCCRGSR